MKAILISIKPKWVAKILNGEKTIEIRKTCPSIFKHLKSYEGAKLDVYIYCTKEDSLCCIKRIGRDRYICGKDFDLRDFPHLSSGYDGKGKVVAKFTLNKVVEYINGGQWRRDNTFGNYDDYINDKILEKSCLTEDELFAYCEDLHFFSLHIDNLEIFDRPKELSEFETMKQHLVGVIGQTQPILQNIRLTKAPQSWCYVEELE